MAVSPASATIAMAGSVSLTANALPNYSFILPNPCNDGHDCGSDDVDSRLQTSIDPLIKSTQFQVTVASMREAPGAFHLSAQARPAIWNRASPLHVGRATRNLT